jgi:hypothetical protein
MTRINCGIPVAELTNKHLLAEHREIKRIPNVIKSGRYSLYGQPKEFTLGTGHVKFFYSRLKYLLDRYHQIHNECKSRGFNVTDYSGAWDDLPVELMNEYSPTQRDISIVRKRINERLNKKSDEINS